MIPALALAVALAMPCTPSAGDCLLAAGAGARITAALASVPTLRVDSVQAGPTSAVARVCEGETCFPVEVGVPGEGCTGVPTRSLCVVLPPGMPVGLADASVQALAAIPVDAAWSRRPPPEAPRPPAPAVALPEPPPGEPPRALPPVADGSRSFEVVAAWGGATAEVLLPFLLGWGIGVLVRRARGRPIRRGTGLLLGLGPAAIAILFYPARVVAVGLWDVLLASILLGAGAWLGVSRAWDRTVLRRAALAAGIACACFALLETASRLFLQAPPETPPPGIEDLWNADTRLMQPGFVNRWRLLDPDDPASQDPPGRRPGPDVLHSGNSVVAGSGVPSSQAFPALLDARSPAIRHVNVALAGTGADVGYVLARNWLAAGRVGGFVLYLHPNFPFVMDLPFEGCGGQPLIDYGPEGPIVRCSRLASGVRFVPPREKSPAPFALAVAMRASSFLGHVGWVLSGDEGAVSDAVRPEDVTLDHLGMILAALAKDLGRARIPWMVVVLPGRPELEGDAVERTRHLAMEARARAILDPAGVPVVDAFGMLEEAVRREGAEALFVDRCCHFSVRGHEIMADWLPAVLAPVTDAVRARGGPAGGDEPASR